MEEVTPPQLDLATKVLRAVLSLVVMIVLLGAGWLAYIYALSPTAIEKPHGTHYHLRLVLTVDGKLVNFADSKYQTAFNQDICTAALTKEPFHFHDQVDQFVHVHWDHMTGGLLLKNYGWNVVSGPEGALGYRFDALPRLVKVPIHGQSLPEFAKNDNFYVYTGDQDKYTERSWADFRKEDLRDFFAGKKSVSLLDRFIPAASAHGDDEKLTRLNDVLGSVVIFAQSGKPTDQQIKDRFAHLVPLPDSTCGG